MNDRFTRNIIVLVQPRLVCCAETAIHAQDIYIYPQASKRELSLTGLSIYQRERGSSRPR